MKKRVHVCYRGRVQGVGFRYTVADLARKHAIAGWVKNLPDGKVEVDAEAEEDSLRAFLEAIAQYFVRHIDDVSAQWFEDAGGTNGFRILQS
jgi:acylphosphatase